MSSMTDDAGDGAESLVCDSLDGCAPKFREAVEAAIAECHFAGLDAVVYESTRSDELQKLYYARGRTQIPPSYTVTNAPDAQHGWHFFGLSVDVISKTKRWNVTPEWRLSVTRIFTKHGLAAGQYWPHPDYPHYQFGACRRSPSNTARELYASGGLEAVWQAVGAN